jgi:hypothetical protein
MRVAGALYTVAPTDAARAEFGIKPGDVPDEVVPVWPCCWDSYRVFQRMGTQWNVGPGGPIGLFYASLATVMDALGIKKKKRPAIFSDIRIMESEALKTMEAQRPKST